MSRVFFGVFNVAIVLAAFLTIYSSWLERNRHAGKPGRLPETAG